MDSLDIHSHLGLAVPMLVFSKYFRKTESLAGKQPLSRSFTGKLENFVSGVDSKNFNMAILGFLHTFIWPALEP
jgi:hypothetical protein